MYIQCTWRGQLTSEKASTVQGVLGSCCWVRYSCPLEGESLLWLCIPLLHWHPRPHALPKQPHNGTPATHHASQGEPGLQGLGRYLSIAVSTRGRKMVSSPPSIDSPPRGLAKRWNNHIGLNSIEESHHKGGSSASVGIYPCGQ